MKALLISPAFPPTFWSFKYAVPVIRKQAALPPLGMLTVAAMLPAGLKIIVGGPLFTIAHNAFPEIDHFILNEAELTPPPFWRTCRRVARSASMPPVSFPP